MNDLDLDWLAARMPQRPELADGARERARRALVEHGSRRNRRLPRLGVALRARTTGLLAAGGVAAVLAAIVLSAGGAAISGRVLRHAQAPPTIVRDHHAATPPLMRLADYVSGSATPAGDATLVARTTTTGGNTVTVYDLYTDDGRYFFSPTRSGLPGQVSADDNLADGLFAREVAAAKLAATGDVTTAAQDMADAPNPSQVVSPSSTPPALTPAQRAAIAQKQKLTGAPQGGASSYDNYVWEDSQDALVAGSGDPRVISGVLRILATLPGVSVTNGSFDGQPTLVLTAGTPEVGAGYSEQLTINAATGVPIHFVGGPPGGTPATTVTYAVSRVTLPDVRPATAATGATG